MGYRTWYNQFDMMGVSKHGVKPTIVFWLGTDDWQTTGFEGTRVPYFQTHVHLGPTGPIQAHTRQLEIERAEAETWYLAHLVYLGATWFHQGAATPIAIACHSSRTSPLCLEEHNWRRLSSWDWKHSLRHKKHIIWSPLASNGVVSTGVLGPLKYANAHKRDIKSTRKNFKRNHESGNTLIWIITHLILTLFWPMGSQLIMLNSNCSSKLRLGLDAVHYCTCCIRNFHHFIIFKTCIFGIYIQPVLPLFLNPLRLGQSPPKQPMFSASARCDGRVV